jgi:hypothetical protein
MIIFPLSIPGKIALILIMIVLGLILYGLSKPGFFKKFFKRKEDVLEPESIPRTKPPKV